MVKKGGEEERERERCDYNVAFILLSGLKSSHKKGIPKISNGNNQK